ncbi:GTPase activating protein [Flagelloscypha sp. PMI_526]|nr:GTPase activating protein [Flagelloscypha sp. PMI_526]
MADSDFLVSVELFVSPIAASALRKKKPSGKSSLAAESQKLREKASWLSIGKSQDATGHWRTATCKLTEDENRSLLNIYVDESILFQTVYIHLLNQTDIRLADTSLFFRKNCIGIFSAGGQRWSSNQTIEPIYLHFPNSDLSYAWLALLRSYALPEIYGTWAYPEDGGAYRMWRRVELVVAQARNLASPTRSDTHRKFPSDANAGRSHEVGGTSDIATEHLDVEVSCEIRLNDVACGKSTTKKGFGHIEWHENFFLFGPSALRKLGYRVFGIVKIPLKNFRRGDTVDGHFPILQEGSVSGDLQVGELRLKIRVDEEIILPYRSYASLLQTFESRNLLNWITDCESKLNLKDHILPDYVYPSLEECPGPGDSTTAHQTLFRGNTAFTKVMELAMSLYGKAFLETSIGSTIRRLCDEKVAIEVDPARNPKGMKDVDRMIELLIHWCGEFWTQIYGARNECPAEMRSLFGIIRRMVEQSYQRQTEVNLVQNRELPWQSVSAFCFLRFIVPGLLHPHLFGLVPGLPSPPVQRSLTLIAKVIQSLANLNVSVQKEEFMRGYQKMFLLMIDYISVVSSQPNEAYLTLQAQAPNRHDRLHVVNSLRQRAFTMSPLARESIPSLPYLLDTPRQLSIITSAVIRHASQRQLKSSVPDDAAELAIKDLCSQCFRVEEEALRRVSQLATHINGERSPQQAAASPRTRRTRRRPSTAPSSSDSDASRRRGFVFDHEAPAALGSLRTSASTGAAPPSITTTLPPLTPPREGPRRPSHLKSPSSDWIPPPFTPKTNGESPDDSTRRKGKGLLRGILKR